MEGILNEKSDIEKLQEEFQNLIEVNYEIEDGKTSKTIISENKINPKKESNFMMRFFKIFKGC